MCTHVLCLRYVYKVLSMSVYCMHVVCVHIVCSVCVGMCACIERAHALC